ncbi:putative mitochondrial protein [Andalucia godoyi]|uniref:Putative mitochondrial protein n=1 Tax=Andalucia godoyi TaxID=505711 RepID=A0A8K0AJ80_ANDGO|nr:putative mitochondrial protein [Andalucia godoyi]|eukprot:ANDGO_00018.mRNA.1 putative mitochondrial protein
MSTRSPSPPTVPSLCPVCFPPKRSVRGGSRSSSTQDGELVASTGSLGNPNAASNDASVSLFCEEHMGLKIDIVVGASSPNPSQLLNMMSNPQLLSTAVWNDDSPALLQTSLPVQSAPMLSSSSTSTSTSTTAPSLSSAASSSSNSAPASAAGSTSGSGMIGNSTGANTATTSAASNNTNASSSSSNNNNNNNNSSSSGISLKCLRVSYCSRCHAYRLSEHAPSEQHRHYKVCLLCAAAVRIDRFEKGLSGRGAAAAAAAAAAGAAGSGAGTPGSQAPMPKARKRGRVDIDSTIPGTSLDSILTTAGPISSAPSSSTASGPASPYAGWSPALGLLYDGIRMVRDSSLILGVTIHDRLSHLLSSFLEFNAVWATPYAISSAFPFPYSSPNSGSSAPASGPSTGINDAWKPCTLYPAFSLAQLSRLSESLSLLLRYFDGRLPSSSEGWSTFLMHSLERELLVLSRVIAAIDPHSQGLLPAAPMSGAGMPGISSTQGLSALNVVAMGASSQTPGVVALAAGASNASGSSAMDEKNRKVPVVVVGRVNPPGVICTPLSNSNTSNANSAPMVDDAADVTSSAIPMGSLNSSTTGSASNDSVWT